MCCYKKALSQDLKMLTGELSLVSVGRPFMTQSGFTRVGAVRALTDIAGAAMPIGPVNSQIFQAVLK